MPTDQIPPAETLIAPYGGELVDLMASPERAAVIRQEATTYPSLDLSWPQICRLELLLTGAYSPLKGFMGKEELASVLAGLTLLDGQVWPLPIVLAVSEKAAQALSIGQAAALRDAEGFMPAILHISAVWPAEPENEMDMAEEAGFPLSAPLAMAGQHYVAGRVEGVALPPRHDFPEIRFTPKELREQFARRGWRRVLAYQPCQPMHRMHYEFVLQSAIDHEANLLVQASAGSDPVLESSGHFTLVRACQALMPRFPATTTFFALSPAIPMAAGRRETLLRAILARNYGCGLLILGGETQGKGVWRRGQDVLEWLGGHPVAAVAAKLGVAFVTFPRLVYVKDRDEYLPEEDVRGYVVQRVMGGEELAQRLTRGAQIPDWFSYPEVLLELSHAYPPRGQQGFTVFFTGLSGAGKSTLAKALAVKLMEVGRRRVTLLDGDIVRKHLSSELGFSKEHRDINIRRIGFVASEITKHGGIAICAPIAPYRNTRQDVRAMIARWGGFIEIHVSTPIDVCEGRDRKGLYAKARAGLIPEFTGVSDPYEAPQRPELAMDTSRHSVDEAVQTIILKLEHEGYLR